jgi:predicted ATPase
MIERIEIKNFKSLKHIVMDTKPLNLLMGLNGMGKSSFIQTLLLAKQSYFGDKNLNLEGNYIRLGKGKDILYQFAEDEQIEFFFKIDNSEFNSIFKYKPEFSNLESKDGFGQESKIKFYGEFFDFQYLVADHIGPQDTYPTNSEYIAKQDMGPRGEYTIHYLLVFGNSKKVGQKLIYPGSKDSSLSNQVNSWLSEISPGVQFNPNEIPNFNQVLLNFNFKLKHGNTGTFKPINVGFGISFVIPVITALLLSEKGRIIILENPESHIHPKGQAMLGKLMALAASNGAQLFVETHSDHILNGIRVAVKEGSINKEHVNISFFDKVTTENEQYTRTTNIKIDKNGELSEYPEDFMDEWNNQLLKLI